MFETLKDRREEGETPLEQARLVELYLLDVLDEICQKYQIKYWLMYGTLLGALRHGGFIPWDDDIDVAMEMEDYKKFLKVVPKVLPETILLQTPKKYNHTELAFSKLRDCYSFYGESHTLVTDPCGIFLDIFPFEAVPRAPGNLLKVLARVRFASHRHCSFRMMRMRLNAMAKLVDAIVALLWSAVHLCSLVLWNGVKYIFGSSSLIMVKAEVGVSKFIERSWVFPLSKCSFEGHPFPAPAQPERVLEICYGDWQKLPPEEKRRWHAGVIDAFHAPSSEWTKEWGRKA